ncbi:MAG: Stk1 family PASTA domain-containing Ser/Thr kinase [Bifidobacteriaceae bacterium]|nr:Stk1 family PASTA domain-containing Ser/Thr kinase [Bifidobacteriaceae bacterium]
MVEYMPHMLAGRYEVGDLIGRGGMAEVHVGRDTRLGRTVAIKVLRSDLARDPSFQARFRKEAQAAASLNHPAIVAVYDTGEDTVTDPAGTVMHLPYIIMEYVEGHTLRELMRDGAALPIDEAIDITIGVLSALQYAHHAGIVHRDIKPANIMLTTAGQVKVMDFGIARALADTSATMTQTQAVIGTAQYLSPEQARGETVDARSDLYSTGCVLYELLTGRPPFVGDSAVSVAYQHVREQPAAPSALAPDVPEVLDRIVMKALAKDRDLRYATASEFRGDLETAKRGGMVAAPVSPITPLPQAAPPTQVLSQATQVFPGTPPVTGSFAAAGVLPDQARVEEEEKEASQRRRRRGIVIGIIAAVVAIIAIVLIFWFLNRGSGNNAPAASPSTSVAQVTVPAVENGMTQQAAVAALKAAGLNSQVTQQADTTVPKGQVISFTPKSGERVPLGSTVTVAVSSGPGQVQVPDIRNMTQDEARATLKEAGLVDGNAENTTSATVASGNVVKTDPKIGTEVDAGTTVTIYLSNGETVVPNVVGMTEAAAKAALQKAGLQVTASQQAYDPSATVGNVIAQTLPAKSKQAQQTQITLTVARKAQSVAVPNVAGMSRDAAEAALQTAGLDATFAYESSATVAAGNVTRTNPGIGGTVKEGDTVTVYLSSGSAQTAPAGPGAVTPSDQGVIGTP